MGQGLHAGLPSRKRVGTRSATTATEAAQFLRELAEAVPYRIHTVLTDNSLPPDLILLAARIVHTIGVAVLSGF